jgi:hypothetical protein
MAGSLCRAASVMIRLRWSSDNALVVTISRLLKKSIHESAEV